MFALQREGFAVEQRAWLAEARERLRTAPAPDLLILDIGLPDGHGLDLCRELRSGPLRQLPVIVLSARSEEMDRVLGLELGADDYLAKPFSPRELVARVRALLRRAQPMPAMAQGFAVDGTRVSFDGVLLNLTKLELGLLTHLLRAPQRIHSRDALLDAVWGSSAESADRTVDTHIKTLRAKLREAAPARDPIKTHRGLGYSLEP
ncbi:MAG: winged helix-turn-helix domain-containing protein [Roseateles sp.]|uniref:winged helix-turn-helix domain-containing protein n=1 Tax=Roseateles sp. TaxID=1971397 RepID=UPI004036045E